MFINNFVKKLFSLLFPLSCVGCGRDGFSICPKCLRKVAPAEKIKEDWITAVWSYKDPKIKKLLWHLKFHKKFAVIDDLGQSLRDHLTHELFERAVFENENSFVLAPIPLSTKKLRERGYNQSVILAKELLRGNENMLALASNALEKIKDGPPQNSIKNRAKRFKNAEGKFAVKNAHAVSGKNIIVVDDITTTHATLLEARRVLKKAGAKKVLAFTVAH